MKRKSPTRPPPQGVRKCRTGIAGLDEITGGGLPKGRPTLICGSAGCGKTLLAMEFLVNGAREFGERGVFVAFEESARELGENVASLGIDVVELIDQKMLAIDHVHVERAEIDENGEFDLEGLFIRLGFAIDSIGATRIVLDTLETLFGGFTNENLLRSELRRLFRWIRDRGITAIVTAERGDGTLTRQGLEEYVSDCVILLDHRVTEQVSTRRLRIVKYRGSSHGTNEYPFLIDDTGITVLPLTAVRLNHSVSSERVSSGIERLDSMLGGGGYYEGSSILISGTAGTGKSTISANFAAATCARGERCLYFAFEESPDQIVRNMRSVGLDLQKHLDEKLLRIEATRSATYGLETHLARMHAIIREFEPSSVILDPVSNFTNAGQRAEAEAMLSRMVDFLKSRGATAMFTNLTTAGGTTESTEIGLSSIVDTWILLRNIELGGERNRGIYVLKSRGMAHSNQIREFVLTSNGVDLLDVYVGPEGVLTGSMRIAQESREAAVEAARATEAAQRQRASERRQAALIAQIAALTSDLEAERAELAKSTKSEAARLESRIAECERISKIRHSDASDSGSGSGRR